MAVNLEELAINSIRQNAEITVRLASIETALLDSVKRSEKRDEQIALMLQRVSLIEERLSRSVTDREETDERVDEIEETLDRLIDAIGQHAQQCTTHINGHCDDCDNDHRIGTLETTSERLTKAVDELVEKVRALTDDTKLNEVRRLATTDYGLGFFKFMLSSWGIWWIVIVTMSAGLAFWAHYAHIRNAYEWITFQ